VIRNVATRRTLSERWPFGKCIVGMKKTASKLDPTDAIPRRLLRQHFLVE